MARGIPGSGNSKYGITIAANVKGQEKIKRLGNSMQGLQGRAKNLAGAFKGLLGPLVAIGGAAVAVQTLRKSFDVLAEREADFATLANGLTRVSTDAPKAAKALRAMADELGFKTLFDEKAFQKGFALLTSFKNIGLDSYGRVAETAADLAQINQVDLKSSFLQLAKALSDPTRGLTALSRSGVIFTEQQREMILELHNSGQEMKAQAEILRIVEGSYKGAAKAAATGLAGAFDTLGQKVRDFNEALGMALTPIIEPLVEGLSEVFGVVTEGLSLVQDDLLIFAKYLEKVLGPVFKWILDSIKNAFEWFDKLFATRQNLEKIRVKEGEGRFKDVRNDLWTQAGGVQGGLFGGVDQKSEVVQIAKQLAGDAGNWRDFYNEARSEVFDKLVAEYVQENLGLDAVIPNVKELKLNLDENLDVLENLKIKTGETGNSLDVTFGEHMKDKLDKFRESIKSVEESMADVAVKGIQKLEDKLVEFVTTGKLAFKDLANSIIKDMIRIAIQQTITAPFTNFISGLFKGPSGPPPLPPIPEGMAKGGLVSAGTSYLVGERGPELLRLGSKGGHITPNHELGGNTSVVVNVDASGSQQVQGDSDRAGQLGEVISQAIQQELIVQRRPGGLLAT